MDAVPEFNGPIEELVRRAQSGEVDLLGVSLAEVMRTALRSLDRADLEALTTFLQQAAVLVELKSRRLVGRPAPADEPAPEPEAPPEEIELPEYRVFREAASALAALEAMQSRVFTRPPVGSDPSELPILGIEPQDLLRAFRRILERPQTTVREVPAEGVTVAERMAFILEVLSAHPDGVEFEALFADDDPRLVVIVTFLALLELIRRRRVRVEQSRAFGPIRLFRTEESR